MIQRWSLRLNRHKSASGAEVRTAACRLLSLVLPANQELGSPSAGSAANAAFWHTFDRSAPLLLRAGLTIAVFWLTWLPFLRHGRPLHRLDPAQQTAFLQGMAQSRFYVHRQLTLVVKLLASLALGTDAGARQVLMQRRP